MAYINSLNKNEQNNMISGMNKVIVCADGINNTDKTVSHSNFPKGIENNGFKNLIFKLKFKYGLNENCTFRIMSSSGGDYLYDEPFIINGSKEVKANTVHDCYWDGVSFQYINNNDAFLNSSTNPLCTKSSTSLINSIIATSNNSTGIINITLPYIDSTIPNGLTIKVLMKNAFDFGSTEPSFIPKLRINNKSNMNKPIKCEKLCSSSGIPVYETPKVFLGDWNNTDTYTYRIWSAYTTLSLHYSSSLDSWIIPNGHIFASYRNDSGNSYIVHSNGCAEEWGYCDPNNYYTNLKIKIKHADYKHSDSSQMFDRMYFGIGLTDVNTYYSDYTSVTDDYIFVYNSSNYNDSQYGQNYSGPFYVITY